MTSISRVTRYSRFCLSAAWVFLFGLVSSAMLSGCATTPTASEPAPAGKPTEVITLQEGDIIKISFPGAANLDSTQSIRRDGRISLGMVGEVTAAGRTPSQLEQDLLKLYANQLVSNEVRVLVVQSSFPVFVSGAVMRPGKIMADRPLTALEAIMEAGGYDTAKANLRAVQIVRQGPEGTRNYKVDLQQVLEGKSAEAFYLQRSDIVIVPERFTWF